MDKLSSWLFWINVGNSFAFTLRKRFILNPRPSKRALGGTVERWNGGTVERWKINQNLVITANYSACDGKAGGGGRLEVVVVGGCKTWWACKIKIKHFYQYEYQQLSLSVFLLILPLYNSLLFLLFFHKNARVSCIFYFLLGLASVGKVHVSNSRSNTDYDPQDILLHCRMVNKIS